LEVLANVGKPFRKVKKPTDKNKKQQTANEILKNS